MLSATTRIVLISSIGILLAATASAGDDLSADAVLDRMQQAMWPGVDREASFEFSVTTTDGERARLTGKIYSRGRERLHLVLQAPPGLKGFALTSEHIASANDRICIYVPYVRRVRELDGNMRKQSFFDTDFNYEDLGLEDLGATKNLRTGIAKQPGHRLIQIESTPQDDWWYSKIVRYVDDQNFLPYKTEYFCKGVGLCRVRILDRVELIAGHASATRISMQNLISHETTHLSLSDLNYDAKLPDSAFECGSAKAATSGGG